ncbi:hypothetical protein H4Q26_003030 [Puccinia striiformis f. sp. tritici PST-130]|nr:hypothetical protein H4Q26_003030 [Puccinia striiformis f. sp. tritici PST-130]
MTPDSVFRHHTPSKKDIRQQKIQALPLSTKNRSTKASSTKDTSSPFRFGPQMLCILCGQSPIKVGGICQACINAAATNTPAITPQILHPANPLMVSHDEKKIKQQEAIACATHLYSPAVGNSSTVIPLNQPQLSFGGRPFRAIVSSVQYPNCLVTLHQADRCMLLLSTHQKTAIPMPSSVPQTLDSIPQIIGPAYNSYRTARVASFDPYPTSQASQAAAKQSKAPALPKPPANKGVLPAINPPAEIAVPCGFEMWSNRGWTPKQKVQPVIHYVNWAYADAYTELQRELCEKFCGKVELVTKTNEDPT